MTPQVGKTYYYKGITQVYRVKVLRVGRFRSLCEWEVSSDMFGIYTQIGFRWNWRMMK